MTIPASSQLLSAFPPAEQGCVLPTLRMFKSRSFETGFDNLVRIQSSVTCDHKIPSDSGTHQRCSSFFSTWSMCGNLAKACIRRTHALEQGQTQSWKTSKAFPREKPKHNCECNFRPNLPQPCFARREVLETSGIYLSSGILGVIMVHRLAGSVELS